VAKTNQTTINLNDLFEDLAANASRNYKIDTLKAHKDNETLKEVVRLALDPFTQFYIRKIPKYVTGRPVWATLDSVLPELAKLYDRELTGNAAIDFLSLQLSRLSSSDAKVLERIIQKDLKCGVSAATANAVWDGLVHEYPCMLCSPYTEKVISNIKFPAAVQLKMDGMRFNAIVRDGKCEFRSRNGKEIQLLGFLEKDFIDLSKGLDLVFDGELIVNDKGVVLDRQTGNGILNKAVKGTISDLEAHKVRATIWDVVTYEEFKAGISSAYYSNRFAFLQANVKNYGGIGLVEHQIVSSIEDARVTFERYLNQGQEGIILKDLNSVWENKRVKHQVKFKGELECDLKIVAIEEGTGKYAGMLGAIVCESADGVIRVSVGSGFTDDQRKNLGKELLGKVAAIKYNARIKNKQGEESLFLPIVLEIRDDKDVADNSEDIK